MCFKVTTYRCIYKDLREVRSMPYDVRDKWNLTREEAEEAQRMERWHARQLQRKQLVDAGLLYDPLPHSFCLMLANRRLLSPNKVRGFRTNRRLVKRRVPRTEDPVEFFEKHADCYLAEAKAILEGKHWEGKNKCVKLADD